MKKFILISLIILTLLFISACGSNGSSESLGTPNDVITDEKSKTEDFGGQAPTLYESSTQDAAIDQFNGSFAIANGQKIIFTADVTLETKDFNKLIGELKKIVISSNGYIVSSSINGNLGNMDNLRNASLTIKVPQASFDSSKEKIEVLGNVINSQTQSQDITKQFVDTDARIKTLKVQEERMLLLLSKAVKLEDIITLESRLSELRLEIESYTGSLNEMKAQTDYATINVYVNEVKELTLINGGFFGDVVLALKGSLKSVLLALEKAVIILIYAAPYIIIFAILILFIKKIGLLSSIKLSKKKNDDKL
jgi:hypothetical protein